MNLTFKDRISFGILYPQKGNLVDQVMVKDISEKVRITQEEIKEYKVKEVVVGNNRSTTWNNKAKDKKIKFTDAELEFLKKQVEELDKKKEITKDLLDLCLKIKG